MLLFLFVWLAIFAPVLLFVDPQMFKINALNNHTTWQLTSAGVSAVVVLIVLSILFGISRSKSGPVFEQLEQAAAELKAAHRRWGEFAKAELQERKKQYERRQAEVAGQREPALTNLESKSAQRLEDAESRKAARPGRSRAKVPGPARRRQSAPAVKTALGALDDEFGKKKGEVTGGRRMTQESARRENVRADVAAEDGAGRKRGGAGRKVAGRRPASSSKWPAELREACDRKSPHWNRFLEADWKLPTEVQVPIRVGSYKVDFAKIPDGLSEDAACRNPSRVAVPFVLPFPGHTSMLWECQGDGRDVAVEGISR